MRISDWSSDVCSSDLLTYLGDADVGAGANIGAGTITCNYDGFFKYRTSIGEGAFIGSNSALVAPVAIGAGAIVAAGSVVTRDVEADALAVARGEQQAKPGWAAKFRERMKARKAAKSQVRNCRGRRQGQGRRADRKSTRLNSSHSCADRMPSSA